MKLFSLEYQEELQTICLKNSSQSLAPTRALDIMRPSSWLQRGSSRCSRGSRSVEKGQKAVEAIVADIKLQVDKANIESMQIDVHYDGSIKAAAEAVEAKYGRLDIVSR